VSSHSDLDFLRPPRPGIILLVAVLGFIIGQVVATGLIALGVALSHFPGGLSALARQSQPPWWANVLSLVGLWVGFAYAIRAARSRGALAPLAAQWQVKPGDWSYVVLGVVLQIGVGLAYQPFHVQHLNRPVTHLFGQAHGWSFAVLALCTTLGAPLMEEWFFRGVLYRGLDVALHGELSTLGAWLAIVASALVFALAHGEPAQFAGLAFLGVVLAWLVRRTKRLVPSIVTHLSFNGVAMVALLIQRSH